MWFTQDIFADFVAHNINLSNHSKEPWAKNISITLPEFDIFINKIIKSQVELYAL